MAVSRTAASSGARPAAARKTPSKESPKESSKTVARQAADAEAPPLALGELSELLGYQFKRAQLRIFEDFIRCVEPLQLTPAQFSVLIMLEKNPGRNQTEIATTLGILRPNFVSMLDGLESRELCARVRSTEDRRSHIVQLTDKGRTILARAKRLVATKHEARLNELLGEADRAALLRMLDKLAKF